MLVRLSSRSLLITSRIYWRLPQGFNHGLRHAKEPGGKICARKNGPGTVPLMQQGN